MFTRRSVSEAPPSETEPQPTAPPAGEPAVSDPFSPPPFRPPPFRPPMKDPSMATNPRIPSKPSVLGIPSRSPDAIGSQQGAGTEAQTRGVGDTGRKLIVGRGIGLSGEISACDHLVVEGRIEAKLKDCRRIDIADTGVFKGSADIQEADIAGRFEGDLSVRGRLELRGSGTVSGTVRYGELMVEAGGRIMGSIEPLESSVTSVTSLAASSAGN